MIIRTATLDDIPRLQVIRNAVKENTLSDPGLVTDADCAEFLTQRGCGWVALVEDVIAGFAIADLQDHNIWALFVDPDFERKGVGAALHHHMLRWYFTQTRETVWLGTAPGTRAEYFYRKAGWNAHGMHGNNEIRFEMTYETWNQLYAE